VSRVEAGSLEITGPFHRARARVGRRVAWEQIAIAQAPEPQGGLRAGTDYRKEGDSRGQGRDGPRWATMGRERGDGGEAFGLEIFALRCRVSAAVVVEERDGSCILHSASCRHSFRDLTAARRAWWARKASRVHPLPLAACCPMRRFSRDEQPRGIPMLMGWLWAYCLGTAGMQRCSTAASRRVNGAARMVGSRPAATPSSLKLNLSALA
jgi:hypothetical protein